MTLRSRIGPKVRPSWSARPTRRPATKAPRTEPTPPMTMTTKVRISTESPMPGSTDRIGATIAPAKPASMAPSPNTTRNSRRMSMPSAATIGPLLAPARSRMPRRVWLTRRWRPSAVARPAAMIATR